MRVMIASLGPAMKLPILPVPTTTAGISRSTFMIWTDLLAESAAALQSNNSRRIADGPLVADLSLNLIGPLSAV